MEFQKYIQSELLILIPVLYCVGMGFKKSKIPDKFIPTLLGVIAIALSIIWVVATCNIASYKEAALALFTSITQGVLTAGTSVYAHQIYVQSKKDKPNNKGK